MRRKQPDRSVRLLDAQAQCRISPSVDDRRRSPAGSGAWVRTHPGVHGRTSSAVPGHRAYGFFGVLYSASFWNGFQIVS